MRGIFVTATGTDAGKTYFSGLLVKWLRENGIDAGYYKPALSGGIERGGRLIPGDAQFVCQTAGLGEDPCTLVSYCFGPAVSPHLAARLEDREIELPVILHDYEKALRRVSFLVVEGCGGAVCPLRDGDAPLTLLDLIQRFGLETIIVSPSGLGAINAAVLTADYLQRNGVGVKGFVLNRYDPARLLHRDNCEQIERLTGRPVLCRIGEGETSLSNFYENFLSVLGAK